MSDPTPCKNEDDCTMPMWCRGRSVCGRLEDERMAQPMTDEQLRASRKEVQKLHPGNRFRLMFGQPLLPEDNQNQQ